MSRIFDTIAFRLVGAGAVVTKSIPPYKIRAGVPARKLSIRPNAPAATL